MKILRLIARLNIGGPARNAVLLTEGLNDIGYETVLVCGEVDKDEGDMGYLAKEKGIEPVVVPELGRELSFWNDWRAFWKLYWIICKEKPDIIHTHTAKAGALGRLAALLYKLTSSSCKVIHTFHGHVLHSYFGIFKSKIFLWIERILARFTDKIIVVSEALKNELVERYKIASEEKFCIVPLGLELDGLLDLELPVQPRRLNAVHIGIVGRLVPVKNHKMLFKVAERICLNNNIKFIVIGDGEMREELERYIEELGISDVVEFRGWIRDLCEIYKRLDIVALTSLNEGTPVSLIEAMAAGRPVVATRVGGVPDVVEDGKSGYLVESGDIEEFSDRLSELIADSEKRRCFGEYGRVSVRDRFSKERLIKDMEGLYNKSLL